MKRYPVWLPLPASIAVAIFAGLVMGTIEAARDERRNRRQSEVWEEANLPRPLGGNGSGPQGSPKVNREGSDSDVPL